MSPLPSNGSKRFRWQARAGMFALLAGLLALGAGGAIAQTANRTVGVYRFIGRAPFTGVGFSSKNDISNEPYGASGGR